MLCSYERQKLEEPKPNQNLIWVQLEKTKNVSINALATKGEPRRTSILYQMQGKTVTKAEEKAQVLSIKYPFASVFISKISCMPGIHPFPKLEDRDGEKSEVPIIKGERASVLPHHVDRFYLVSDNIWQSVDCCLNNSAGVHLCVVIWYSTYC